MLYNVIKIRMSHDHICCTGTTGIRVAKCCNKQYGSQHSAIIPLRTIKITGKDYGSINVHC